MHILAFGLSYEACLDISSSLGLCQHLDGAKQLKVMMQMCAVQKCRAWQAGSAVAGHRHEQEPAPSLQRDDSGDVKMQLLLCWTIDASYF